MECKMANFNFPNVPGNIARALRENFNITQEELTKVSGFSSKSTISKIESSGKTVKREIIENIFVLAQSKCSIDEEEFSDMLIKFKKNAKLETKLLGDEMKTNNKQFNDMDNQELSANKIIQDLLSEKRELNRMNFENIQAIDELRHQFDKYEELQRQRFDLLQERFKELTTQFDNLRNHDIKNYISNEYFKIKDDVINYIQEFAKSDGEAEKETGLSGLLDKINSTPALNSFVSSIGAKAGDSIGDFVSKILSKLTNSQMFDGIPVAQKPNFSPSSPFPQSNPSNYQGENYQNPQDYNNNSDVFGGVSTMDDSFDDIPKRNRQKKQQS